MLLTVALCAAFAPAAAPQVSIAILHSEVPLPTGNPNERVFDPQDTAVNGRGGYAVAVRTLGTGPPLDLSVGSSYFTAVANSTGEPSSLTVFGSTAVAANDFTLQCSGRPQGASTLFLFSDTAAFVPGAGGSQGNLCVGGASGPSSTTSVSPTRAGECAFAPTSTGSPVH